MNFEHISVLLKETVDGLDIKPDGIYVDGTLGGGGHSEEILKRLTTGKLIGIDQDENALKAASERLSEYGDKFVPVRDNFSNILEVLKKLEIHKIDGMMMDLGVSSHQLDEADRGFSYRFDAPLDMRMDQRSDLDAYKVVNTYSEDDLNRIFKLYGEENWARRIAKFICEQREEKPIETTLELVDLIYRAIPAGARKEGGHPAKRTFQAIRIEVNGELEIIKQTIEDITSVLNKGGRISIITFHSLEDRLVKQTYKELATGCICPPELPVCMCNNKPKLKVITRKPILPSQKELEMNARSKSAKLRVAKRI
ncbi:16S rRNA (cytosine(1402)-N(4))-methyltransferase RsmH [Acidaminobacter sp. JC074]|uniref:16S rRNA (cytosine(1402)-N(4))-methyltransferase RsmH n=1 Tax=Acidaminobacter sp. JC074 TaxID=2530199 RepID=UPI001F0DB760|nr:16S rRNA (cytosine(1402)-N(4))-methyltransferase RsmH [Acidaminobacter sp. JC074]MCH4890214.1 16S rRNA (cytosine(1402)-N(4))-methyltransferase RsmH [Acidaminobacter sp. JC074]